MFNSITPISSEEPSEYDLHQQFVNDPNLFPEITDPQQREDAVYGFERYLKVMYDIFMEQPEEQGTDYDPADDHLRQEWQKRF